MDIITIILTALLLFAIHKGREKESSLTKEEQEIIDKYVLVDIELINDHLYFWDKHSKEFLGQGKTIDDVSLLLKQRFPEKIFVLDDLDASRVGLQRKKLAT